MRPVVFKGCRGWFHSGSGDSGVILCSSIGEEDLRLHYHLVALSNIISSSGISVIRFNYRGTGDSADLNEGASEVRAWIDSIVDAVDWMRSQAGVRTFVLVGFKLGANLAAAAIPSLEKILALVLIAPCLSA
jgi:alpha/beta superfamily hydrolase